MKKYLFFLIIICLCASIISCDQSEPQNTERPKPIPQETVQTENKPWMDPSNFVLEYDENNNVIKQGGTGFSADCIAKYLTLIDIDMYNDFANRANLPKHFVRYETISAFGEFDSLVVTEPSPLVYEAYLYGFINEGEDISLYVYHNEKAVDRITSLESRKSLTDEDINLANMRRVDQKEMSYYYYRGIYYCYSVGGLLGSIA